MRLTCLTRRLCLTAWSVVLLSTAAYADPTIQDFSAIFPPDTGGCANPIPLQPLGSVALEGGYWDGRAVRLTEDLGDQNGGIALNQAVSGAYSALQIDFQFQMNNYDGDSGADGIGFAYANVNDVWGPSNCGIFPDWGAGESPSVAGSLGIGLDNYNNAGNNAENSVTLHWNSQIIDRVSIDNDFPGFLESGDVIQASIQVVPGVGGSNVTVRLTDIDTGDEFLAYDNYRVDGLLPYDGRSVFKARTGGAHLEHMIDNVSVTLTPAGGGNPFTVLEDFESYADGPIDPGVIPELPPNPPLVGGTPYSEYQGGPNPPVRLINDGPAPGPQPGHMQLTNRAGSLSNSIAFNKTSDVADNIEANFKLFIDGAADGVSFLILDPLIDGDEGEITGGFSESPNRAGALAIGFDIYDNGEAAGDGDRNHLTLHYDGVQIGDRFVLDPAVFTLYNARWNDVKVIATEVDGGMSVTVQITDATDGDVIFPILDEFVADASFPDGARAAFGARTGGATAVQSIDDVYICWTGICSGPSVPGDFNNDGVLDAADINALTAEVIRGTNDTKYDLDANNLVNDADRTVWVSDLKKVYFGDADLNGEFNSTDFVTVFLAGKYENGETAGWEEGDWDGNGLFQSGDFVTAFLDGGYELGPKPAVASVPEPSSLVLIALGSLCFLSRRRSR